MKKMLGFVLISCLMLGAMSVGAIAQLYASGSNTAEQAANASQSTDNPALNDLLKLLPASDIVAVVDVGRAFNDLLPRLANLSVGGIDKMAKDIQGFTDQTGIDPSKVQNAVIGLNLTGLQATGAIIVQGLDLNGEQVDSLMKALKAEYKNTDYNGAKLYNLASTIKAPTAGPLSVKTDETAMAVLGGQKVVFGDLTAVKSVIDINAGAANGGITQPMLDSLNETNASSLVRFALNIPDNLREEAAGQGDLFKSLSTIKMIHGTFDVAQDFALSLDAIMRTASESEATELEMGLKGLLGLVRGFFGSGDPSTEIFGKLIDQIQIGSKMADVSLSISLPRSILEQFSAKSEPSSEKKP